MNINTEKWSRVHELQKKRTKAFDEGNNMEPDDIRTQIDNIVDSLGFQRLGSGDYRIVYGNGDIVVKVAWHNLGKKENKSEYQNWRHIRDIPIDRLDSDESVPAKVYLGHLIEYDSASSGWLVMEQVSTGSSNVTHEEASKLRESLSEAGINIDEIKPYNMGRKYRKDINDTVPVVFDYGGT